MKVQIGVAGIVAMGLVALGGCGRTQGSGPQRVRVEVTDAGFTPSRVEVRKGRPVVVTFERRADQTCGTDVVFSTLHRGYDLPLNKEVPIELSAADIGDTLKFTCSMEMLHGMIVAR